MSFLNTLIPNRTRTNLTQEGENGAGVPTVRPVYEIKENADSFDLTARLPGVATLARAAVFQPTCAATSAAPVSAW